MTTGYLQQELFMSFFVFFIMNFNAFSFGVLDNCTCDRNSEVKNNNSLCISKTYRAFQTYV